MNSKPCTCHLPISHCVMHTCQRAQLDLIKNLLVVAKYHHMEGQVKTLMAIEQTIVHSTMPVWGGAPRDFQND